MKESTATTPTVDAYLKPLPPEVRDSLQQLRAAILSAAPLAEEVISYQIPTYKQNGALVHFAAFATHCSFVVVSKTVLKTFAPELASYKTSGTTIHFSPDHPLPAALIKKIVKARILENEERRATKELAQKPKLARIESKTHKIPPGKGRTMK